MPKDKKFLATGLLAVTVLIVVLLASGISGVKFQAVTDLSNERDQFNLAPFQFSIPSTPIWFYLLMFAIWVILPVSIVLFIKYPSVRKRTFEGLVYVAMYGLILFLLTRKTQEASPELEEIENELIDTSIIDNMREAAEFISSTADANSNLSIVLDITIIILVGLVIWSIYRRFFYVQGSTADQIKAEAERAIDQLRSGADLNNVIIRCYADMSNILIEQRGVQRHKAMTPREFERELSDLGLPKIAVHSLTDLFEKVRYGNIQADSENEEEAINCLKIISEAC